MAVIAAMVVLALGATTVSALLVSDLEEPFGWSSLLRAVAASGPVLLSGIAINFLPKAAVTVWRRPEAVNTGFLELMGRVGRRLRRPAQVLGVFVTVVLVVAAGLVLRPPPTGLEPGPLVIMVTDVDSTNDARATLLKHWSQLHPENPASFSVASGEPDDQHERMVRDAQDPEQQTADLYSMDNVWTEEFALEGYIQALDEADFSPKYLGDLISNVLDTCRSGGRLWCLPFNADVGLLFCRSDVPEAEIKSWDDYHGAGAKARKEAVAAPGVEAAYASQLGDNEALVVEASEAMIASDGKLVASNGEPPLNAEGDEVLLAPGDREAVRNLALSLKTAGTVLEGSRAAAESEATAAFTAKKVLCMRNWPTAYGTVEASGVPFEVKPLPHPSILGGQNLAVSASTERPRAARALLEFLASADSQLILSENGNFAPTRQSTYIESTRPYIRDLREAVDKARPRPKTRYYLEYSRVFREGINEALNNEKGDLPPGFARDLAKALAGD